MSSYFNVKVTYVMYLLQGNAAMPECLYGSFRGLYNIVLQKQCAKFAIGGVYDEPIYLHENMCSQSLIFHIYLLLWYVYLQSVGGDTFL